MECKEEKVFIMDKNEIYKKMFEKSIMTHSNTSCSWKKIGDNYAQFSMFNPSEYKTETTCCIKTN